MTCANGNDVLQFENRTVWKLSIASLSDTNVPQRDLTSISRFISSCKVQAFFLPFSICFACQSVITIIKFEGRQS